MNDDINFKNNPLHGLSLKNLLIEIVDHYGFEILHAYLNINCFKTNASIESSIKFLKKTDWAREKVEAFYMYQYKNLPKASSTQFQIPPRDRIVPEGHTAGAPAELSLEDAQRLSEKRAKKAAEHQSGSYGKRNGSGRNNGQKSRSTGQSNSDNKKDSHSSASNPWGNWEK